MYSLLLWRGPSSAQCCVPPMPPEHIGPCYEVQMTMIGKRWTAAIGNLACLEWKGLEAGRMIAILRQYLLHHERRAAWSCSSATACPSAAGARWCSAAATLWACRSPTSCRYVYFSHTGPHCCGAAVIFFPALAAAFPVEVFRLSASAVIHLCVTPSLTQATGGLDAGILYVLHHLLKVD